VVSETVTDWPRASRPGLLVILAIACLALPTMFDVARESWSTEQGAHGPIVLVTGLWLLIRELRRAPLVIVRGNAVLTAVILVPCLILFALARIAGIIEIEGFAMYASLILIAYTLWGGALIARIWFPLIYLLFVFPPPDTVFAMVTQPLKILISETAVSILHAFDYPIAGSGVTIQIGQYQMLVAAACAGLNSLLSLTALGLFYTYIRHSSNFAYMVVLVCFILPIAILANLVRVLLLLLITYHFGEAAGQGFFHEVAGLSMFATALVGIFLLDWLGTPLRRLLATKVTAA
jgi:exosortase